jgi:hypothetical protein
MALLSISLAAGALLGCSMPASFSNPQAEIMTGDENGTEGVTPLPAAQSRWKKGDVLFVASDRLRLRSSAENSDRNIIDILTFGDEVQVLAPAESSSDLVLVLAQGLQSRGYVGRAYLRTAEELAKLQRRENPYFIIQNIATQRSRLYKKCILTTHCPHELVAEMKTVVGADNREMRTWLGSFKITQWFKFYVDGEGRYPAWYDSGNIMPPRATDPLSFWFEPRFMGRSGRGEIRGAFGWFAAHMTPNVSAQWIHGTFGWGSQKELPLMNTQSHGCTRLDNESVAFLRSKVDSGTPIFRIYAKEVGRTPPSKPQEPLSWNYILTSDSQQNLSRDAVLAKETKKSLWLEQGTYQIKNKSQAVEGNIYRIPDRELQGRLLVDEGRVSADYQHPRSLEVGGYRDQLAPREMIAKEDPR